MIVSTGTANAAMVIDHIGVVVKSLEDGIKQWSTLFGYRQYTGIVENTRQKVRVVFLVKENSLIVKLVEPVDQSSPVYQFSLRGGGLHHLCFKCEDVEKELERLSIANGVRVLRKPEPGEAFENNKIAFLFAGQGMNVELIDTGKKSAIVENG